MKKIFILFIYLFTAYYVVANNKVKNIIVHGNTISDRLCTIDASDIYISKNNLDSRINNPNLVLQNSILIYKQLNDARIYLRSNNFSKALEKVKYALQYSQEKKKNRYIYISKEIIADIYLAKEQYDIAIKYYLEILNKNHYKADIYNKLIFCFLKKENFERSFFYILKSNTELPKDEINRAFNNKSMSLLYSTIKKDTVNALIHIKEAILLFKKTNLNKQNLKCTINLYSLLLKKDNTLSIKIKIDSLIDRTILYNMPLAQADLELINARIYSLENKVEKSYQSINAYESLIIKNYDKIIKYKIESKEYKTKQEKIEQIKSKQLNKQKNLNAKQKTNNILYILCIIISLLIFVCSFLLIKIFQINKSILVTKEKLEVTKESKNKFFSIISHDLRSPFNNILGFSNLLKMESENENNINFTQIKDYTQLIKKSTKNVLFLMNNLIEWANTQQNNLKRTPEAFNIDNIIKINLNLYKPLSENKRINMTFNSQSINLVFADKNMINTVMRNLINNAIKFTPEEGQINITYKVSSQFVNIEIKDTGCGMTIEEREKLFNFNNYSRNNEKGIGLGLIICKEFIEINKGKLWIKSEENKGSSFFISIPKAK